MGVPALQLTLFVVVGRTQTSPTEEATLSADMAFHIVWYCNLSDLQRYGNKDYVILRYLWSSVCVEKGHTETASCFPVWLWMSCAFLFCEWDLTHCVDRWMIRWFGTITRTMELFIKMRQKKKKKKKRPKLVLWSSLHDNVPTVDDKSLEHSLGKVDSVNWSVPLGSHWNSSIFISHLEYLFAGTRLPSAKKPCPFCPSGDIKDTFQQKQDTGRADDQPMDME